MNHPALQAVPGDAPPSGAASALAVAILSDGMSLDAVIERIAAHFIALPRVELFVVSRTSFPPDDARGWVHLGQRAWIREWLTPGTDRSVLPPAGAGPEAALTMPWLSQLARQDVVALVDRELLPCEAEADRRELSEIGVRSLVASTNRAQSQMFGSFSMVSTEPGNWPEDHVADLRLLNAALTSRMTVEHERRSLADSVAASAQARHTHQHFLASVGHELRTPLAAIHGYTEMLMVEAELDQDNPLSSSVHRDGRVILRASEQLASVMDELFDAGQTMHPGEDREHVDVAAAVEDVIHWHRAPAAGEGVALRSTVLPGTTVWSGPARVRQVLVNLVSNAIVHNVRGGTVVICTEPLVGEVGEDRQRIIVRDDGPGLTAEQLATVFDPFVRFSPDRVEGNGLGLPLARSIAGRDSGTIGAESTPGVGSAFWVELPVGRTDSPEPRPLR